MPGMTFAEAYLLRKESEATIAKMSKNRKREIQTAVSSMADMEAVMRKMINGLDEDEKGAIGYAKSALKQMPPHFVKHVTTWQDEDGLDLLHHVIIDNKPELLVFIYVYTNYFPPGYIPPCNPYAHLAAILGHADCLKVILQHRPGAFFKSDKPSHAIKLPAGIMKKTKLDKTTSAMPRNAKFLSKIKDTASDAERMLQSAKFEDSDVASVLDKELGAIEKSFTKSKKRLPKLVASKEKQDRRKPSSSSREKSGDSRRDDIYSHPHSTKKPRPQPFWARLRKAESEDSVTDHFRRRLKPEQNKHLITVFWDALSYLDGQRGSVAETGEPAKVIYGPTAHIARPDVDLDRINFHTMLAAKTSEQLGAPSPRRRSAIVANTASCSKVSKLPKRAVKTFEPGVRGAKKYKEFQLKPQVHSEAEKDDSAKHMNKTPLTHAAEHGHYECVQIILEMVVIKRHPTLATREPLTMATMARSPEAIMLLLEKRIAKLDYQSAVMLSIREMYPDCLAALLTSKSKERTSLFEGTNLYHILYSQSVISSRRHELMPEMTRALISCKEDVNAHSTPRTYPMYTLINCAFNITVGKQIFYFIQCLNILLECKANPHFDETKQAKSTTRGDTICRQAFRSAISCVFESAKNSVNFFESTYWSKVFMKKFITTIEFCDLSPRRVQNTTLFDYMDAVCALGLDRTIVKCLLRYGSNPDHKRDGKYPVNVYFDHLLPYLTRFEIIGSYEPHRQELVTLMVICRAMSIPCLSEALHIFLVDHLLSAPLQGLPISREFASMMDSLLRTPRPLVDLASNAIWRQAKRNKLTVRSLPISEGFMYLIIP